MDKIKTILEEIFACSIDWQTSYENDLIGCATICANLCINIWASKDKAEIKFINPTPFKDDLNHTMRWYISCFSFYTNVKEVKKITNRLVIKFKDL